MLTSLVRLASFSCLLLPLPAARAAGGAERSTNANEGQLRGVSANQVDHKLNDHDIPSDVRGLEDAIESEYDREQRHLGDVTSSIDKGLWYTFFHKSERGTATGFVVGCSPTSPGPTVDDACPGAPGVTLPTDVNTPPWTITSSTCTKVTWTETWYQDNQFQLYVNGLPTLIGSTPGNGPNCGEDPNVCYLGGKASNGTFVLPPGRQSITFKIVDTASSDRGAFKVDTYPCPAGNVNKNIDTGEWFLFETNYIGQTFPSQQNDPSSPWTFYSPCAVNFTVAEVFISNNQWKVYDFGVLVGTTNVAAQDRCSDGYIDPDTGCLCEGDFDVCIANGAAHGTFQLPAGSHSITIEGYPSLIDYGGFKITSLCAAPTKAPTRAPTKRPTKAPSQSPTSPPTLPPTSPPTTPPTTSPSKPPTKAPIPVCPLRETTATFELWDGNTNARVSAITNTSTVCLKNNWNIRAVTTHEQASCGPVRLRFYDPRLPNATLRRQSETLPPYFLFGDNAYTGDVYGNTNVRPRVRGLTLTNNHKYCIQSVTVSATGYSEQCFTNLCG